MRTYLVLSAFKGYGITPSKIQSLFNKTLKILTWVRENMPTLPRWEGRGGGGERGKGGGIWLMHKLWVQQQQMASFHHLVLRS